VEGQHACKLVVDQERELSIGELTTATPRQCDKSTAGGNQTRQSRADYGCRYRRGEEGVAVSRADTVNRRADVRPEDVAFLVWHESQVGAGDGDRDRIGTRRIGQKVIRESEMSYTVHIRGASLIDGYVAVGIWVSDAVERKSRSSKPVTLMSAAWLSTNTWPLMAVNVQTNVVVPVQPAIKSA
jgi:hypothetical protein